MHPFLLRVCSSSLHTTSILTNCGSQVNLSIFLNILLYTTSRKTPQLINKADSTLFTQTLEYIFFLTRKVQSTKNLRPCKGANFNRNLCYFSDDSNDNNALTNSTSLRKNRLNSIRVIHKKATTATLQTGSFGTGGFFC